MTRLRVQVAWASPSAQGVVDLALPAGATVGDAVAASNAIARAGIPEADVAYAIHGETAGAGTPLRDGDRVELTRPLVADPKAVRRDRARRRPLAGTARRRGRDRAV